MPDDGFGTVAGKDLAKLSRGLSKGSAIEFICVATSQVRGLASGFATRIDNKTLHCETTGVASLAREGGVVDLTVQVRLWGDVREWLEGWERAGEWGEGDTDAGDPPRVCMRERGPQCINLIFNGANPSPFPGVT